MTPPKTYPLVPAIAVAAFVIFVHGAWWVAGDAVVVNGNLVDGDSYARLLRVTRLVETGDWFDSTLPRANAPFGGSLHWTRLFDVLLVVLALPLSAFFGFEDALFRAGVIISPILHVIAALALAWAARPLIGRAGGYLAGALTTVQFGIVGYATVGHADHHLLFALITILALGFMFRALAGSGPGWAAGAALAAGLWVGPEALIVTGLCLAAGGLVWLAGEEGGARLNVSVCLGLTLGLVLVVLAERGPAGFFDVGYDRVSIVYVTGAALVLAFWAAVRALSRPRRAVSRVLGAGVGVAAAGAVLWALFPKILLGPLGDVDPDVLGLYANISELTPVGDFPRFLVYLGGTLIAVPWSLWRLRTRWGGPGRWGWCLAAAALIVYLALAVNWIRGSMYVGIFVALFVADLITRLEARLARRPPAVIGSLAFVFSAVVLTVGPLAAGVAGVAWSSGNDAQPRCPIQEVSRHLNGDEWGQRPRIILASPNFGPELLYRTPHRVVGTLHHPNAAGILDSIRIFGGNDEARTLDLIRKRRVDLIMICVHGGSDGYIRGRDDDRILYRRLVDGNLPPWARAVQLPLELNDAILLFEIDRR